MRRTITSAVAIALSAVVLSACTSATDSDSNSAAAGSTVSACTAEVDEVVDAAREPAPLKVPTAPLDLEAVKGKNIWLITVLTNQFTTAAQEGFEEAAAAAGMKVTVFDGQGQTNRWNEGVAQAVARKADAIALLGIEPALLTGALSDAAAAGIPVVNALSGDASAPLVKGVFSNISADYTADGGSLAAWTLADSGCTASAFFAQPTAIEIYQNMADGAQAMFSEYCRQDCQLDVQEIDLANAATDLPQKIQTALQRATDTGYIISGWDSGVPFVGSAVATTNPNVKILGRDGIAASLDAIRAGRGQDVTVAAPPEAWLGWAMVDDAARAITGVAPAGIVIPTRLIDETNVGATNDDVSPNYTNFQAEFQDAWAGL